MNPHINLTTITVTKLLLKIIACLLFANLISIYLKWELGYITGLGFVPFFDFDQEYNLPAFYSALAILFCAALLWFVANDNNTKTLKQDCYWKILSYFFILLSLDELTSIHNQFSRLTIFLFSNYPSIAKGEIISQSRYWIISFIPLLMLVSFFFIRFYIKLPKETKIDFFFAGTVFIAGAVGVELMGDQYMFLYNEADIYYGLLYTLEELLEMLGIVLFVRALVSYISNYSSRPLIETQIRFLSSDSNLVVNPPVRNLKGID